MRRSRANVGVAGARHLLLLASEATAGQQDSEERSGSACSSPDGGIDAMGMPSGPAIMCPSPRLEPACSAFSPVLLPFPPARSYRKCRRRWRRMPGADRACTVGTSAGSSRAEYPGDPTGKPTGTVTGAISQPGSSAAIAACRNLPPIPGLRTCLHPSPRTANQIAFFGDASETAYDRRAPHRHHSPSVTFLRSRYDTSMRGRAAA
jgi:hypothetical protein